ncbi:MAG: tyrosine-protein phosphatase [Coxiella-like endosymbiont]|uniref:tyrosine-protein phosphatase n=1 Tax=Coxiella-like endosymbiont TaxID=1592897 RepID=UPI00215AB4F6|nr:tyrosine-protein phosphatase [Coxiella-like endosymbiont]UVE59558.1 tyrosine-protein phosphatase [Coxiella-like endosymbiont]
MALLQKNKRKWLIWLGIVINSLLLSFLGIDYFWWRNTAHTVISQKIYRSAQLSPQRLKEVIQIKHIKTIINLRGAQPCEKWYLNELRLTKAMGVKYFDVPLPSYSLPSQKHLEKLVSLLLYAPQPILVHCLGGADRSGLASAVAMILEQNAPISKSQEQFSIWNFVFSDKSVGKVTFSDYFRWLAQNQLTSNRQNFLEWVFSKEPLGMANKKLSL